MVMDLAIALSLKDMISGQLGGVIEGFKRLEGVTDEVKKKLGDFKNIGIAGGTMLGAGALGLDKTLEALDEVTREAASFEDSMTVLMNKSFGKDLIDPSFKNDIAEFEALFSGKAMEIGASTTFDSTDILDSMTELVKGGIEYQEVLDSVAEANAYFAQINRVAATATAEGTVQMKSGFRLVGDEVLQAMELVNQYADATIADSLDIQQALGNVAGTAATIWQGRNSLDIAKETIALTAITTSVTGDESAAATYVRNFLDRANMEIQNMSKPQIQAMTGAGWIDSEGHSVFIDYETGMLKDVEQMEAILEEARGRMSNVEFSNLLDTVFQDRGKKVAEVLADTGALDISVVNTQAQGALSIADQVELEMSRFNAVKDTFAESVSNFKKVIGAPFLEPSKSIFSGLASQIEEATEYFKQHPEVTKYIFAIAGGISAFLLLLGAVLLVIAAVGSMKLAFNIAGPHIIGAIKPVLGVMGPVMLGILALAGVAYILYKNWDKVGPHFESIFRKIQILLGIAKQNFSAFVDFTAPYVRALINLIEKGVVFIALYVLPMIDTGLSRIISVLRGDFRGAWESLTPWGRVLFIAFAPVLAGLAVMLAVLAIKTLFSAAAFGVKAAAMGTAAAVGLVWRGVMLAATVAQTIWNVAMGTGTAVTLLQKAAVIGFLPVILAIKAAKVAWTAVQWLLNAAMAANPIGAVILIIAALIAVVVLVVMHFKEIVEWVGKAWDKLKGFLGFKNDIKEDLEDPITVSVQNDALEGIEIPVMPVYDNINQMDLDKMIAGADGLSVPADFDFSGMEGDWVNEIPGMEGGGLELAAGLDFSDMESDWLSGIPGMEDGASIPADFDFSGMEGDWLSNIPGMEGIEVPANIDTAMFTEQMEGLSLDLGTTGTEAGEAFAAGFSDQTVIADTEAAVASINNAIKSNLISDADMKTWGGNLIDSFISGMRSKFAALETAAKDAAIIVGDYMKVQSPTRKGDLSTNNVWGINLIKSFADGMLGSLDLLKNASEAASGNVQINGSGSMRFYPAYETGGASRITEAPINLYIYGAPGQSEEEIANKVIKKLEKKGRGKTGARSSLVMSPVGFKGGY